MTLIVDALDRAARQCSLDAPSSWLTATEAEYVSMRDDFLLETVADVADRVDLPSPIGAQQTLTGTGTANSDGSETFSLNSAFLRLARDVQAVYDPLLNSGCDPITTDGDWTFLTDVGSTGTRKYYRVEGYDGAYTIDIYRAPGSGATITVSYITNYWMADSAGTVGTMFTDAEDVLLMPRRLVESGIVWRFRERYGLPYQDKFAEYEALLARVSNDRRGRRIVSMGPTQMVRWQDMAPAYIPSS